MTLLFSLFLGVAGAQQTPPAPTATDDSSELVREILSREQQILDGVRAVDPAALEKLERLRTHDRAAYLVALIKASRMIERGRSDPAMVERYQQTRTLEADLQRLAAGFSMLSPTEQVARRAELERLASELMDLRQAERRARVEELRAKLADLESELARREQDRSRIVSDYVDELVEVPRGP